MEVDNNEKESLHALILDDRIIEFYDFRKSVVRKYGFGEEHLKENQKQKKELKTSGNNGQNSSVLIRRFSNEEIH